MTNDLRLRGVESGPGPRLGFLDFPIFLDLAGQGTPMAGRPSSKYFGKYPKKFLRAWQLPISGRRSRYFKLVFGILLVLRQQKG
jgi:hypothetical protein